MGLAAESASVTNTKLPLGSQAYRLYEDVIRTQPELARKDFSCVYKYLEDLGPKNN